LCPRASSFANAILISISLGRHKARNSIHSCWDNQRRAASPISAQRYGCLPTLSYLFFCKGVGHSETFTRPLTVGNPQFLALECKILNKLILDLSVPMFVARASRCSCIFPSLTPHSLSSTPYSHSRVHLIQVSFPQVLCLALSYESCRCVPKIKKKIHSGTHPARDRTATTPFLFNPITRCLFSQVFSFEIQPHEWRVLPPHIIFQRSNSVVRCIGK